MQKFTQQKKWPSSPEISWSGCSHCTSTSSSDYSISWKRREENIYPVSGRKFHYMVRPPYSISSFASYSIFLYISSMLSYFMYCLLSGWWHLMTMVVAMIVVQSTKRVYFIYRTRLVLGWPCMEVLMNSTEEIQLCF